MIDVARRFALFSFLAAAFAVTFSIFLGQVFLGLALAGTALVLCLERRGPVLTPAFFFSVAFLALAAGVSAYGVNPARSFHKISRLLWFVAVIPLAATLVTSPERLRGVLTAFSLGTVVLVLDCCVRKPARAYFEMRAGEPGAPDYWTALINQGSMTGAQMLMLGILATLGLLYAAAGQGGRQWRWVLLLLFQAAAFVISFKRGSWMAGGVAAIVFISMMRGWKRALIVILVALAALALPPVRARLHAIRSEMSTGRGGRMTMWFRLAPRLVREHPRGIGYAALNNDMMRRIAPNVERNRKHLHSNIVQILVELGWAGCALYLAWMLKVGWDGIRRARLARAGPPEVWPPALALLMMLLALFLNGLVEYNFGDTEIIIAYSLIMGAMGAALLYERPALQTAPSE